MSAVAPLWLDRDERRTLPTSNTAAVSGDAIQQRFLRRGSFDAQLSPEVVALDQMLDPRGSRESGNGPSPARAAFESAREWVDYLREAAQFSGRAWVAPHIAADDEGEISFEWWRDSRKITIYFGAGRPEFIKVWGAHMQDEMTTGELASSDTFRSLWIWLNTST